MDQSLCAGRRLCEPWNKGKLAGQKAPLRLKEIWAIRIRLQLAERARELALFNLAVDSKLRSCDLVKLGVRDITRETDSHTGDCHAAEDTASRAIPDHSRLGSPWQRGSAMRKGARRTSYFPVACERLLIFRRVSTLRSCVGGSERSDSIRRHMATIRCAVRKRH
jgi:hypothetical protein